MELVWTRDGNKWTDTIHRAGCNHTRTISREVVDTLTAATVEDAKREIYDAHADGSDDEMRDFPINVAACVR